jgi:Uri superfamily endonuclease
MTPLGKTIMPDLQDLPASHGVYVLYLFVSPARQIAIGRLGCYHLPAGYYLYVGSACGAGGLRARVGRHLHGGVPHWHIDYLRALARVQGVLYTVTDNALECKWSQALAALPKAFIPIPHFGSRDCRSGCAAHLIAVQQRKNIHSLRSALEQVTCTPIRHLCFL